MQLINQMKRVRRRPLVTVCWLDREVSFAVWRPEGKNWRCLKVAQRREANFDGAGYREELAALVAGLGFGRARVCWLVLREAWPEVPQAGRGVGCAEVTLALPGWIRRCWEGLEPRDFPDEVVSGLGLLESVLWGRPEKWEPGTGFLMRVGSRFVLIGRGERGQTFRRVSRRDLVEQTGSGGICREWLLQTRTLFRNRTGLELKRVYVAEETGIHLLQVPDFPIEIEPAGPILFQGTEGCVFPASACRILHGSCVAGSRGVDDQLQLAALSQRQRWHKWERRLQTSTGLLLGCWGLLLLGACRHEAILPEIGEAEAREWQRCASELKENQKRWQRVWTQTEARSRPFELIARVVRGRPDGVEVNRVRVSADGPGGAGKHSIRLEGTFSGEAGNPAFRRWIGELRDPDRINHVRNLTFARGPDGIAFSLDGSVSHQIGGEP
jgi:hypothetical protein